MKFNLKKYELFWIEEPKSFNCEVAHKWRKFSWSWRSIVVLNRRTKILQLWSSTQMKKIFMELKYELFWIEEPKSFNCEVAHKWRFYWVEEVWVVLNRRTKIIQLWSSTQRKKIFMELKKYELFWIEEPKSFNCEVVHKGRKFSLSWRSMSCFKLKNQNPLIVK
jgi:hypothetical protein